MKKKIIMTLATPVLFKKVVGIHMSSVNNDQVCLVQRFQGN